MTYLIASWAVSSPKPKGGQLTFLINSWAVSSPQPNRGQVTVSSTYDLSHRLVFIQLNLPIFFILDGQLLRLLVLCFVKIWTELRIKICAKCDLKSRCKILSTTLLVFQNRFIFFLSKLLCPIVFHNFKSVMQKVAKQWEWFWNLVNKSKKVIWKFCHKFLLCLILRTKVLVPNAVYNIPPKILFNIE